MLAIVYSFIQLLIVLLLAPLMGGIIKKIKALSQKRIGAPVLQMYYDLWKLMKKESVVSETSSWIYNVSPFIVFSSAAVGAMLVPVTTFLPAAFSGDIILLFYLLALGRFFMCLSALDTGSTFGGMGASREALISALIEPTILVSVFTIGLISGTTSINQMMASMKTIGFPLFHPVFILTFFAMVLVVLAETSRIPVDDPATHLELTMVHEAMLLEYSGRQLALMEYGAAIKQLIFITLLANLFLPSDQLISISGFGAVCFSVAFYLIKVVFITILIAITEISTVKFRFFSIPNLAALAFILSFLGFLQYFVLGR